MPLLTPWMGPLIEVPWAANLVRLIVGFAVLAIPSTAMGATLPILLKALLARDQNFGSVLGRLYGWNTLGAVVGAVAGEAVLLEWLGVRGSALFAGSLNLLVAVVALAMSGRFVPVDEGFESGESTSAGKTPADEASAFDGIALRSNMPADAEVRTAIATSTAAAQGVSNRARRLLAASFLSGFALLALEVVWFRFLLLYLHGTSLVFSLMLSVVLSGIALGGLVSGRSLRSRPAGDRLAPFLSLCSCVTVVLLYGAFDLLPQREQYIAGWLDTLQYGVPLMLLPAFLSGVVFTCLGSALAREIQPPTRAAGWMILWNTLGSGLGSLAGGFLLLPLLGIELSFFAVACVYLLVAWLALPAAARVGERVPRGSLIAAAAIGFAALAFFPFGLMENSLLHRSIGRFLDRGREVAAVKEGRTETIVLLHSDFLGRPVDPVLCQKSADPKRERFRRIRSGHGRGLRPTSGIRTGVRSGR